MNAPTPPPLLFDNVTKRYGAHTALRVPHLELPAAHIIGLLGRNGSGKTTLLEMAGGLLVPTSGRCLTLGRPSIELDNERLQQIGVVHQEDRLIFWLTVGQHLDLSASFYPRWDATLEKRLLDLLELDPHRRVGELNVGDRQKLSVMLALCPRPSLLLLDEPMSALDPVVRSRLLKHLLERLREDGCTIVISSHLLADVEKVIDWVVCLHQGEVTTHASFDDLRETYAEWIVTARSGRPLPARFDEAYVLAQESDGRQARLTVHVPEPEALLASFREQYDVEVRSRPLPLDELFPWLVRRELVVS